MKPTIDTIKSLAEALTINYGRPPTIEEIARAYALIEEIAGAFSGDRFEVLPSPDPATGMSHPDDYRPYTQPWRVK